MKIFVSYSRRDSGDFANQINRHLSSFNYDIFTDVDDIRGGDIWSDTIEINISNCDIFVVIVTSGSLHSPHVEREVLQAQRENKKIIPCFFDRLNINKIKWGLERIQGVEFSDKYELARDLYSKIYSGTINKMIYNSNNNSTFSFENKYFESAEKFEQLGLPEKAIEMYDVVLKKEPENFEALFKKSLALAKLTKYDKALESLENAIYINPKHHDVWYYRGFFLEEMERYDDALKSFDIDLRIDKQDVDSSIAKARVLEKIGRNEETLNVLDEIINLNPKDVKILEKKGAILDKLSRFEEAIKCYEKVLEINPNDEDVNNKKLALERLSEEKQSSYSNSDPTSRGTMPAGWKPKSRDY